jgi:hypothetical protein
VTPLSQVLQPPLPGTLTPLSQVLWRSEEEDDDGSFFFEMKDDSDREEAFTALPIHPKDGDYNFIRNRLLGVGFRAKPYPDSEDEDADSED